MLKYITSYTLQNFRIAGCLLVLSCLLTSAGHAQGWIVPLGKGVGKGLEKTPDGNYIVGYERDSDVHLARISKDGVILDSVSMNYYGKEGAREQLLDMAIVGDTLFIITCSYPPPPFPWQDYTFFLYKTPWESFITLNLEFRTYSNDTAITNIVRNGDRIFGGHLNNCNNLLTFQNNQLIISLSCLGGIDSRYWKWSNMYLTTLGSSSWIYAHLGSGVVDTTFLGGDINTYLHPSFNGYYMGGLGSEFKLVDTNFQIVNTLTDADLSYANAPNTQIRDGLCSASDGGFYYAAHYNNWSFPTIYLGKIDALGNHAWIRAYPEYIFAAVRGVVEAVEGDGAVMLVEDEFYQFENPGIYLMKTAADGTIGVKENTPATFQIYPNPVREYINIVQPNSGNCIIHIYNPMGQLITSRNLIAGEQMIDVSGLFPGHYTVQLTQQDKVYYSRFIKN